MPLSVSSWSRGSVLSSHDRGQRFEPRRRQYFKNSALDNSKNIIIIIIFFQTQKTVFEARTEKRCDIHFKKECWIDYKEQSKSQTIHVCTTKPERKCDLTAAEKEAFGKTECNTYYETVSGILHIN